MPKTNGHLINAQALKHYLSLPGERALIVERKHWLFLAVRLIVLILFSTLALFLDTVFFTIFVYSPTILISSTLILFLITSTIGIKIIVDWYCHIYLVTTRKILEICYSPFFSDWVSDVLLDQVRCTEVNVKKNGIIFELLNIGDITITFDRPTHEQECTLSGIHNPQETGIFLGTMLVDSTRTNGTNGNNGMHSLWFREKDNPTKLRFMEEIFPSPSIEVH